VQRAYPSDFWVNQRLGDDLRTNGNAGHAIRYQTAALALRPKNPGMLLNRALAHADLNEWDAALSDLDQALKLAPRYAVAWQIKGRILSKKGDADGAFAALEQAAELNPKEPRAQFIVDYALQMRKLREAVRSNPRDSHSHLALARSLRMLGLWNEAEAEFRKAFEAAEKNWLDSQNKDGAKQVIGHHARWWGGTLESMNRYSDAANAFQKAIKVFEELSAKEPGIPSHQHYLADSYRRLAQVAVPANRVQEAETAYRLAIEIHEKGAARFPGYPHVERIPAYLDLAMLLSGSNCSKEAKALYEQTLELYPNEALVSNRFAWFLATCPDANWRDPARAVELAKQAVQLWPADKTYGTSYWNTLGAPYYHAGTNWTTLGVAHYRADQWKDAIAALQKSIDLRKHSVDGEEPKGDRVAALQKMTEILKGADALDWLFLAMSHWKLDQKAEARTWYDRAMQRIDNNSQPYEELGRVRVEAEELLGIKKAQ
jgi:tetratricopeptide (TPR) repeat protein